SDLAAACWRTSDAIARTRGERRPHGRATSSAWAANGVPYVGAKAASARCCAGESRPWRNTKLLTGRCGRSAGTDTVGFIGGARGFRDDSWRRRTNPARVIEAPLDAGARLRACGRVLDRDGIGALPARDRIGPGITG